MVSVTRGFRFVHASVGVSLYGEWVDFAESRRTEVRPKMVNRNGQHVWSSNQRQASIPGSRMTSCEAQPDHCWVLFFWVNFHNEEMINRPVQVKGKRIPARICDSLGIGIDR